MKILVIAEAPDEQEDKRNTQLIGPAGQVLRKALAEFGINLDRDCRKTNAVRCRPPGNRRPTGKEIVACAPHIWDEIRTSRPKLILLLGQVAVESFLLNRLAKAPGAIGQWRGFCIPDQKAGCWVCPTFHPSYILRSQRGRIIRGKSFSGMSTEEFHFNKDLENALQTIRMPHPRIIPVPEVLTRFNDILARLRTIQGPIAFDYETTGLRPYQKGHKIISVGISDGKWAGAVPLSREFARQWKSVLSDPSIKKVAHNMKFEHQWSKHCLGVETKGWLWDSMLAAHILDYRRGITSLKTQAYIHLGVDDWGKEVRESLGASNEDGFNSLANREPTPELLQYNAKDAFYTYLLFERQRKLLK